MIQDGAPFEGEEEGVILFDGVCVLCSRSVDFVLKHDKARRFRFLPIQTPRGRDLAETLGLEPGDPQSIAVVLNGRVWLRSSAVFKILGAMPSTRPLGVGQVIPAGFRDLAYRAVARRRYRLFGQRQTCRLPTADDQGRLVS